MTPPRPRARTALFLALALALPLAARAQPAPSSTERKAAAQALFDEAMSLRKKESWPEVCAKLQESLRLDPAPGTRFYLAECLEQTGKHASAWLLYTEVADAMANTGQHARETAARDRAAALSPKLARLRVDVPPAARVAGLVIKRDGVTLGEAQWGFAAPVDAGPHTIEATAPEKPPFTKTIDVTEPGQTIAVELPPWSTAAPPQAAPLDTPVPTATLAPDTAPLPFSFRTAGILLGGISLAGVAAGSALGALALSKHNESNRGPCDLARDVCTQEGLALRSDAITAATGSTVAFVAAGVLFAGGVTLLLWPQPASPTTGASPPPPPVSFAPTRLVATPGGLSLEGTW
ncbi:MAG: hypothetical protein R3B70_13175 [Polyangiaceae bacterium]